MKPWSDIQFKHIPVECLHLCRGPHRPRYTHSIGISTFFYYSTNNHIREIRKKPHVSNLVGQMCFLLLVRHSNWVNLLLDEFHCIVEFHCSTWRSISSLLEEFFGSLWNSKLWKPMKTNTLQSHGISLPEICHQV